MRFVPPMPPAPPPPHPWDCGPVNLLPSSNTPLPSPTQKLSSLPKSIPSLISITARQSWLRSVCTDFAVVWHNSPKNETNRLINRNCHWISYCVLDHCRGSRLGVSHGSKRCCNRRYSNPFTKSS